tara:strand:- start:852 stop:1808 length:957 start_codon:yes stop_codon:yes gene_type:complete
MTVIEPSGETVPVFDSSDAADDAVILYTSEGQKALIVGTNKRRGLELYNLTGTRVGYINTGRLNNVDAKQGDAPGIFLLAASNRTTNTIDIFKADIINETITLIASYALTIQEPYGLCVSPKWIFVGNKEGIVQMWAWDGRGPVSELTFASQTEGCVVDRTQQSLYVGEENHGIWKAKIRGESLEPPHLFKGLETSSMLVADIEGLDIYYSDQGNALFASSQGDNSYVAYNLDTGKLLSKFYIVDTTKSKIDGTSDTDGISIFSSALPGFPAGILVVQDGFNTNAQGKPENQNFKIIDMADIKIHFTKYAKTIKHDSD